MDTRQALRSPVQLPNGTHDYKYGRHVVIQYLRYPVLLIARRTAVPDILVGWARPQKANYLLT